MAYLKVSSSPPEALDKEIRSLITFSSFVLRLLLVCLLRLNNLVVLPVFQSAEDKWGFNHLFFADDCLLFCKENSLEWSNLIHILGIYEKSSGQSLKKEKTSIFFSSNTPRDIQHNIIHITGIKPTSTLEKYLGLPALLGKINPKLFIVLSTRLGPAYPIGRLNSYWRLAEKFFSSLFFKQFQHMLWAYSFSQKISPQSWMHF